MSSIGGMNPCSRLRRPEMKSSRIRRHSNDFDGRIVFFEPSGDAHQRAAGAQSGHEHVYFRHGVDDLGASGLVVGPGLPLLPYWYIIT